MRACVHTARVTDCKVWVSIAPSPCRVRTETNGKAEGRGAHGAGLSPASQEAEGRVPSPWALQRWDGCGFAVGGKGSAVTGVGLQQLIFSPGGGVPLCLSFPQR